MTDSKRALLTLLAVGALLALNGFVLQQLLVPAAHPLRVSFLDVGQGDSIFIESPTGIQMLIDGGPDRAVVREIPKLTGPLDRDIDLIVMTHPDKDHIAGLPDVFEKYEVSKLMSPNLAGDTDTYSRVVASIEEEVGLEAYVAKRGQRIHLGGGAYADVLYPDKDVSRLRVTNDASIVLHVVYGKTSFMLTGDLPSTIEDTLAREVAPELLQSTVLKAGHHGSKYSTSDAWLTVVASDVVVISAGKGNTYGHPAPEALSRIQKSGAKTISTIDEGTITFESNGIQVVQR
jgi:competence protein ComEC